MLYHIFFIYYNFGSFSCCSFLSETWFLSWSAKAFQERRFNKVFGLPVLVTYCLLSDFFFSNVQSELHATISSCCLLLYHLQLYLHDIFNSLSRSCGLPFRLHLSSLQCTKKVWFSQSVPAGFCSSVFKFVKMPLAWSSRVWCASCSHFSITHNFAEDVFLTCHQSCWWRYRMILTQYHTQRYSTCYQPPNGYQGIDYYP